MKSKINYKDNSIILSFSLKTWVYILNLIRDDLEKHHTSSFKGLFPLEFFEMEALVYFEPPFGFKHDAIVSLKVKGID